MATGKGEVFQLYLLRHAHAAWPAAGRRDFDRVLDEKGRAEAEDVARQAGLAGLRPEMIISSPAARCLETSAIFAETTDSPQITYDETLYTDGMEAYVEKIRLNQERESLMLVGHNPMIEGLAAMLGASGQIAEQLAHGYPTAGLLSLEFDRPLPSSLLHKARTLHLLTPDIE